AHHVGNGDDREIKPPRLAGRWIGRGRPGRPHAGADHIGADDEVLIGIKRTAGTDHGLPPAGLAGDGMLVEDMLVAGQRMADENGIAARRIERAVSLIGDLERREIDAAIEPERRLGAKLRDLRCRVIGLMRALFGDRWTGYRLYAHHRVSTP